MEHIKQEVIVILGSPNDENGQLLETAKNRLQKGFEEYQKSKNFKIILTGGRGEHFNKTKQAHAFYAKKFLLELGALEEDILEYAESRFTLEDALLTKSIIDKHSFKKIIVITSDYHISRAKYIFEKIFNSYTLQFIPCKTIATASETKSLELNEKEKLEKFIRENKMF